MYETYLMELVYTGKIGEMTLVKPEGKGGGKTVIVCYDSLMLFLYLMSIIGPSTSFFDE